MQKTSLIEIVTEESCVDIDLKSIEDRIFMQSSTKGTIVKCSYSISVTGIVPKVCSNSEHEVMIYVIINPEITAPAFPRYSVSWNPVLMRGIRFEGFNQSNEN